MRTLRTALLVGAGLDLLIRGPRDVPAPVELPATPRRRAPVRLTVMVVWGLVSGFTLGLLLCLSVPRLVGDRSFTELSGSMRPTLQPGDVLLVASIMAREAEPGDVVTFTDPAHPGRLLTHRVRSIHVHHGYAHVITKGDANNETETWSVPAGGHVGRVRSRIPKIGYLLVHLGRPGVALALIALPSLLLGAYELRRIWRKP